MPHSQKQTQHYLLGSLQRRTHLGPKGRGKKSREREKERETQYQAIRLTTRYSENKHFLQKTQLNISASISVLTFLSVSAKDILQIEHLILLISNFCKSTERCTPRKIKKPTHENNPNPPPKQTRIMEDVATYLCAYEVRNWDQKLVLLNLKPVHSSMQHSKTDTRKKFQDVLTPLICFLFDTSLIESALDPGNRNQAFTSFAQLTGIPRDFNFLQGSV